jgi:hypothetical protein
MGRKRHGSMHGAASLLLQVSEQLPANTSLAARILTARRAASRHVRERSLSSQSLRPSLVRAAAGVQ